MEEKMDFLNVSVDETTCAALRGHSVDKQRRDRKAGRGPKPLPGIKPRYLLRDIQAERETPQTEETAA
jgi:hypothetical protein